jgi:hypothetical protein
MRNRQGCLAGLLELFFINKAYEWGQSRFGFGQRSCSGCGCGLIMLLIFILVVGGIICNTNWLKLF